MKYLKGYKLFKESLKINDISSILEDLEDILITLIDDDNFHCKIKEQIKNKYTREHYTHRIEIYTHASPYTYDINALPFTGLFKSKDIIYYVERCVNYLKSLEKDIKLTTSIADSKDRHSIMKNRNWNTPVPTLDLENYKEELKDLTLIDIIIEFNIEGRSDETDSKQIEELLESLNVWHDALLTSIDAEEVDIFNELKLPKDIFFDKLDLEFLDDNVEFINSLSSLALKKSESKNSDDFETFVNKPCKFMFIYDINSNELENPVYLLFQVWNESLSRWNDVKLYKIKEDVKRFYDKLTSRTIEILDGDENFIYGTSNGNEWILQNINKENDIYKKSFRKEELQDLIKDRNIKVNVV